MDYKVVFASLGIGLAVISYLLYFRSLFQGTTKPHAFSWFVWALLELISFAVMLSAQAGLAAWVNGISGLLCLVVAMVGLKQKIQVYTRLDKISLSLALLAIALWQLTGKPALAIIFVVAADLFGFIPTFRKSYHYPWQETTSMYAISSVKYILVLLALEQYNFATWFYPAVLVVMDSLLVAMLLWRRQKIVSSERLDPTLHT